MSPTSLRRLTLSASALVLAISACRGGAAESDQPDLPPVTVDGGEVVVLAAQVLSSGPLVSGSLAPERQATIRAEVPGVVLRVHAEPGQAVAAGQLLVEIDDAGVADAALSARSAVRSAEEALGVATREAERTARLAEVGAASARDLEQARWAATNAETGLADAKARLATAEKQLRRTRLTAPFSGVVSERPLRAGDLAQVGTAIMTLVDPRSLRLEATVPVAALPFVRVGTEVRFQIAGVEEQYVTGRITRVNPVVDPGTGQVRITVTVPNESGRLVAGLYAQGSAATERKDALAVPLSAVDDHGLAPVVRRIRGGVVKVVTVTLGLRDDVSEMVEIVSGLAPGDTVLLAGSSGMPAGTRVVVRGE